MESMMDGASQRQSRRKFLQGAAGAAALTAMGPAPQAPNR
ncbi:twin-arginine translocation signal domain-containing protein [Aldersonia kunmingensis]